MKKYIAIIFVASSLMTTAVFGEPTDAQPLTKLDPGTTLTLLQDINIPQESQNTFVDGEVIQNNSKFLKKANCVLSVVDQEGHYINQDTELGKGSVLKLVSTAEDISYDTGNESSTIDNGGVKICEEIIWFVTNSGNQVQLSCSKGKRGLFLQHLNVIDGSTCINVGDFKMLLSGIANLNFASPKQL